MAKLARDFVQVVVADPWVKPFNGVVELLLQHHFSIAGSGSAFKGEFIVSNIGSA
jgi:hypothetical protein